MSPLDHGCQITKCRISRETTVRGDVDGLAYSDVFTPRVNRLRDQQFGNPIFWQRIQSLLGVISKESWCLEVVEVPKSYNTSNLVSHLRSQHPNKYTEFSKVKVEKEGEKETARKERSKAPGISGCVNQHFMVKAWTKLSSGI